jgi:serine/threonine-protein kinase
MKKAPPRSMVGRYELHSAIASGGMATVHLGRLRGQVGFSRIVAIKRLHPSFAETPTLVSTLLDEARLCSRIQHPNVVATLDMVAEDEELSLVLEYVHGETLARLLAACDEAPPVAVVASVMANVLHGLHAAHEATSEAGEPLGLVHRDVSPQNVLVGADGLARVLDFGVAKARGRLQTTREGQVKGKLSYMAPEQIRAGEVDRRTDVFAAGVVMWEALTLRRLFSGENEGHVLSKVLEADILPPSDVRPLNDAQVAHALDDVVMTALARDPDARHATARAFALAIEEALPMAPASTVSEWVKEHASASLAERAALVEALERGEATDTPPATADAVTEAETLTDGSSAAGPVETRTDMSVSAGKLSAPAADPSSRGRGWWLVAAAVAGGAAVAGFILREDTTPNTAPAGSSAALDTAAKTVELEVVTTPPGAYVTHADERHGPTPVVLTLPLGDAPIAIEVARAGYRTLHRDIVPDKAQRLELSLEAASSSSATTPPPPPRPAPRMVPKPAISTPKPPAPEKSGSPFYRFD